MARPLPILWLHVALLSTCPPLRADKPDLDLPADSPVMESLRRVQSRTGTVLPSQASPLRESAVLKAGAGAWSPFDSSLNATELRALRPSLVFWSDPLRGHDFRLSPVARVGFLANSQSTSLSDSNSDSEQTAFLTGMGITVSGKAFSRLSFYSHAVIYTEFTDRAQFTHQFDPRFGETYSVEKSAGDSLLKDRTFNRFENYLLLDLPWITLKAGRDRVRMGPGYFSSSMAGAGTPPYYMLEARIDFAPWLSLDDYLLKMTDTDYDIRKYANLHRFEFKPRPWLEIGFQDIVIYQDRDPDWAYLLPLVPLSFAEANNGGRDNAAMGFDFLCARIKNLSFWGEVFIDDLVGPATFFDGFWENRWSGLAGFQAVSPWPEADADLVVEYGHVEPWTYNGRKPQTSFRHYNVSSASKLGPDSRSLDVQASYRPTAWLQLRSRAEWNEKGIGRGATLGTIHDDALDGTDKEFLGGATLLETRFTQETSLLWRSFVQVRLRWTALPGTGGSELGADAVFQW
ncbi:MAG: capsule assembly Wzi family protein [Fibrobacteria bacterium]